MFSTGPLGSCPKNVLVLLNIRFVLPDKRLLVEAIAVQLHNCSHGHLCGCCEGFKYLFLLIFRNCQYLHCRAWNGDRQSAKNLKGSSKKQGYYPRICLDGLRRTSKNINRYSWRLSRDSKRNISRLKVWSSTAAVTFSVFRMLCQYSDQVSSENRSRANPWNAVCSIRNPRHSTAETALLI